MATQLLPDVGEVQVPLGVEDEVVEAGEAMTVRRRGDLLHFAGGEGDGLDAAAYVALGCEAGRMGPPALPTPAVAAVVGHPDATVVAHGEPVRSSAGVRGDRLLAVH